MKLKIILAGMLAVLSAACTNETDDTESTQVQTRVAETTFENVKEDISVMVFKKNNGSFLYEKTVTGGWTADGKRTTSLELGWYKFLYSGLAGSNEIFEPTPIKGATEFGEMKVVVKPDPGQGARYILPADQIWLPLAAEADKEHHIVGEDSITADLKRMVSRAVVILKKGYRSGTQFHPIPYEPGRDVRDDFSGITLDIQGVANTVSINGVEGNYKTFVTLDEPDEITDEGFGKYYGPFVIPTGNESVINAEVTATGSSSFSGGKATVTGLFEKNKYLEITLWATDTFVTITVEIKPIDKEETGDTGIWQ